MKRLIVDFQHLVMRNLFKHQRDIDSFNRDKEGAGYQYLRYMILSSLFSLCDKFSPDEFIVATDGKRNWRKQYYKEYKAHRKKDREKSDINWSEVFGEVDDLIVNLRENFPFKVISHNNLEADDIIAWFCREFITDENIIVSSDKDLYQLLKYVGTKQWDPIKKKIIKLDNPHEFLRVKILTGDKGDNVPPVKPRVGEKTAEKILADEEKLNELLSEHKEEFKRNTVLIDLDFTPKQLLESVKDKYDAYEFSKKDLTHIYKYFMQEKMKRFADTSEVICKSLKPLL